ncbi:type 1 glutamine amidotransferase-like domain-containing protein [archaeon]|nr:type 1 glutamine amidotransferase-like domain-containing protein [archaeon]MBT6698117.1 type 1 glutamine amidotransferase-like domain-containing protein [archaeon]
MKFYLSSYKLGNKASILQSWFEQTKNKKIALIPNAIDYSTKGQEFMAKKNQRSLKLLAGIGLEPEVLDLKDYFNKKEELKTKLSEFAGVFIRGGNTFVLRAAMKLSGFDQIITQIKENPQTKQEKGFIYSGYSAGICILAEDMHSLQIVDDPNKFPYAKLFNPDANNHKIANQTIWEGLGFLTYMILPHYDSDHPESADIEKEVKYCKDNNLPYKTLRDGEVIIIE